MVRARIFNNSTGECIAEISNITKSTVEGSAFIEIETSGGQRVKTNLPCFIYESHMQDYKEP